MKFRKKPVVIDAVLWDGWNFQEIRDFFGLGLFMQPDTVDDLQLYGDLLHIKTLEGVMTVQTGDWIIKGVKGEFYPIKPAIFEETYDLVEEGV